MKIDDKKRVTLPEEQYVAAQIDMQANALLKLALMARDDVAAR